MYKVISELKEKSFHSLGEAIEHAKTIDEFVTIKTESFEIVGRFGVAAIENGKCPDGIDYTWMKRRSQ